MALPSYTENCYIQGAPEVLSLCHPGERIEHWVEHVVLKVGGGNTEREGKPDKQSNT